MWVEKVLVNFGKAVVAPPHLKLTQLFGPRAAVIVSQCSRYTGTSTGNRMYSNYFKTAQHESPKRRQMDEEERNSQSEPMYPRRSIKRQGMYENNTGRSFDGEQALSPKIREPTYLENWAKTVARTIPPGSDIDWEEIRSHSKESNRSVNDINFGGIILRYCLDQDNGIGFHVPQSLTKWIGKLNLAHMCLYLRACGDNMDKVREEEIFELYEKIKKQNRGIWELHTAENVIYTISKTAKWKECLELLGDLGGSHVIQGRLALAATAFEHKDFDLGWSLLLDKRTSKISQQVLSSWLKNCPKNEDSFKKLVDFCDLREVYPAQGLISDMNTYLTQVLNYQPGVLTSINPASRTCSNCHQTLNANSLTTAEFESLRDHFLINVLVKGDVFQNTSPEELEHYKKFITLNAPFDYVLDGLNIAYGGRGSSPNVNNIKQILMRLVPSGKKVLVIGRKHMTRWHNFHKLKKYGFWYLTENTSEDDPFILYATLTSGSGAFYISKDFMRTHIYNLGDIDMARLFKRWRLTQQLYYFRNKTGWFNLLPFTPVLPVPQRHSQTKNWHIPFEKEELATPYDFPTKWMCFVRTNSGRIDNNF